MSVCHCAAARVYSPRTLNVTALTDSDSSRVGATAATRRHVNNWTVDLSTVSTVSTVSTATETGLRVMTTSENHHTHIIPLDEFVSANQRLRDLYLPQLHDVYARLRARHREANPCSNRGVGRRTAAGRVVVPTSR